jgi:hypothetical protein
MIRKALFLIGNRHFLIRKRHFGIRRWSYVAACSVQQYPLPLDWRHSHDPPPTLYRRRSTRFDRHCRLLRHDCSEEHRLPAYERLIDLLEVRNGAGCP